MLKFIAVPGLNKKNYIKVTPETQNDLKDLDVLRTIVSRTEYKPFAKGFNKNVYQSYFINDTYIPIQFIQDIKKKLQPILSYPIVIENDYFLYNNDLLREDFNDYSQSVILPETYDIYKEGYEFQMESVFRALIFKIGRIEIGTSGGKTLITYLYCRYLIEKIIPTDKKILIIVPRQLLAKQSLADFASFEEFNPKPILMETIYSGSKKVMNAKIIIGTYQSLCEYDEEYYNDFYAVICDEVQTSKANSIRNHIYSKCKETEYFFGLTGTYPDYNTLDYLNIVSLFGPLIFVKKTWELIKDKNSTPVFINKIKINYNAEYKDFSLNLLNGGFVGTEKYRIEKKFFQNHEPRNLLITKLINNFEGNHLILVESVEYCKYLKEFITEHCPQYWVDIIYGAVKDRDSIIDNMKQSQTMVLIATYETMSTGVSIKTINNIHFPDGGRSEIRIKQSLGRGLRLHELKELLNIFDYQDNMPRSSFKTHAKERNKIYEKEKHPSKEYEVTI